MKEYIMLLKNAVPTELCDIVLEEYENTEEWQAALTSGYTNKKTRNLFKS